MTPHAYVRRGKVINTGNAKTNKYGAKKCDGYDSKHERSRAWTLEVRQRAGLISNLRRQVPFLLIPTLRDSNGKLLEKCCKYIADFVYTDADGNTVVEDAKGVRTEVYRIKRKLMLHVHGIIIKEV